MSRGTDDDLHRSNSLLSALSASDFAKLRPHLSTVDLKHRAILSDAGERIRYLYFPHTAVICLMAVMRDSGIAETATIGPEGMVGFEILLGRATALNRVLVQVPGAASRISSRHVIDATNESASLRSLVLKYVGALFVQTTQSVACNSLHKLEERCSRWLLMAHDRAKRDRFNLTQDFLAEMLGVHRPTVTLVARTLQAAGVIDYSRGVVTILDRDGLEACACECYGIVRHAYEETFLAKTALDRRPR
jgi:CRP-like cAMP-binding protein